MSSELQRVDNNNSFWYCKLHLEATTWTKITHLQVWKKMLRHSSKTQVNVYQTARCNIPDNHNLYRKCCNNFNSHTWTKHTHTHTHAPSGDGTAVHSGTEGHDSTADVSTAKVQWHLITHTNGTFPQSLINCQLQAVFGNTFNCQQDKIRDQECICKELKTGIMQYFLHSSLHTRNWQFINYSAQCFMSAWKM